MRSFCSVHIEQNLLELLHLLHLLDLVVRDVDDLILLAADRDHLRLLLLRGLVKAASLRHHAKALLLLLLLHAGVHLLLLDLGVGRLGLHIKEKLASV